MAVKTIKFCVGDRTRRTNSYVWRLWWGNTSFYAKPSDPFLAAIKVSLHGPDERPLLRPGFKVALDEGAVPKATAAGGLVAATPGFLPRWFPGDEVAPGVRHVLRLRVAWDLFRPGVPSAPSPGDLRRDERGFVAPPPPEDHATDLDVFVGDARPYWPNEARARRDNAVLGPLANEAGQFLTAVAAKRSVLAAPAPAAAVADPPESPADGVRGLGGAVDERGFFWLLEQLMSRRALQRHHHEQPPPGPTGGAPGR